MNDNKYINGNAGMNKYLADKMSKSGGGKHVSIDGITYSLPKAKPDEILLKI